MRDFATSEHPGVTAQLARISRIDQFKADVHLEKITELMRRLGHPERALPPTFHVAGTNGKGSTCAFLRAALEAAEYRVHVHTSPHLVRLNERIRIAGQLIDDANLADVLKEVNDSAKELLPSFFEVMTAAALLVFSRIPADACVVEVGLGGRLDATNVIPEPVCSGIAQLGLDHQHFLGETLEEIASEKVGIAKRQVPLVTMRYPATVAKRVEAGAAAVGAVWLPRGRDWDFREDSSGISFSDGRGTLALPRPVLPGNHQAENAALAVAMLRHQRALHIPDSALNSAMGWAEWPARLQRLGAGPLHDLLPAGAELWLDGGHNPAAARAVADFFRVHVPAGRPFHIVFGLLANKDLTGVLKPFAGRSGTLHAVPVPGHEHHAPADLAAAARAAGLNGLAASDVAGALGWIARHAERGEQPIVLILGSLYLAGEVLRANGQAPV